MQQYYIEIITTSFSLSAIFITVMGILLFFSVNKQRDLKINTLRSIRNHKLFIISSLICGLIGYIVGKIGLNSISHEGNKAFCEFCTKVSIIMVAIDTVILLVVLLITRRQR